MCLCDVGTALPLLHISSDHPYFPRPAESHRAFGAGFILIGVLLGAESLAGRVWYRSRLRSLIFPATLIFFGWGMLAVTVIEPDARFAHFAMGMPMMVGGWTEARVRSGDMQRRYADLFIVAALLFSALETSLYHLSGPPGGGIFITHASLALTALLIAGLRLYQGQRPASLTRSMLVSAAVISFGIQLYIDSIFQPNI